MSTETRPTPRGPKNSATTSSLNRVFGELLMAAGLMTFVLLCSLFAYRMEMPRIVNAILLSAGVTLLVYHFLGGFPLNSEFKLGALRVGGSMAVLLGVASWLNTVPDLDPQSKFHVLSTDSIAGSWDWKAVDANTGIDGTLNFNKDFSFSGTEYRWEAGPNGRTNHVLFFEMSNGKWSLSPDRASLSIESDVTDHVYDRTFHWKTTEPLTLIMAFGGQLWPHRDADPNLNSQPWGILITKNTSLSH